MSESNFIHPIEDIASHTGLPRKFVERCNAELAAVLEPYRIKGDKNRIFYNSSGLVIFDRIKQLKERGYILPRMREVLGKELVDLEGGSEAGTETSRNTLESREAAWGRGEEPGQNIDLLFKALQDSTRQIIEAKEEAARAVREAKDEIIEAKDETIQQLKSNLQLLTDGRSVEEVRTDVRRVREQEEELGALQKERERWHRAERERQVRRLALIQELERLEGMFFVTKRRQVLLREIKQLEEEKGSRELRNP